MKLLALTQGEAFLLGLPSHKYIISRLETPRMGSN
jgi:hypothetical protein